MIAAFRAISATLKGSNARFWAAGLGGLCLFVLVVIIAGAFMRFKNPEVWKLGVAVLGPYVTAVGFLFALQQLKNTELQVGIAAGSLQLAQKQNRDNQNWKKNEFLAARMREFLTDETTARALEMLDYSGAEIEVTLPGNEEPASVYVPHGGMDEPVQSATGKWLISLERCLAPHTERAPHQGWPAEPLEIAET